MTPIPCGAAHPESPGWHCYCNLVDGHAGPHFSAYSNIEWSNTDEL